MVKPGPLSPNDAAYLNDQLRELEVLKRRVEGLLGQAPELIPAAVTSQTTVSWTTVVTGTTTTTYSVVQHGWYEEGHNVQGTRVTLIGGRTGTNLVDPARMPNGSVITPTPTPTSPVRVWLRKVGLAGSHGMIHEIVSVVGGTSGTSGTSSDRGLTYVSSTSIVWNFTASTSNTAITTMTVFSGLTVGYRYAMLGNQNISAVNAGVDETTIVKYEFSSTFQVPGGGSIGAEVYTFIDYFFSNFSATPGFVDTFGIDTFIVASGETPITVNMQSLMQDRSLTNLPYAFNSTLDLHLWREAE